MATGFVRRGRLRDRPAASRLVNSSFRDDESPALPWRLFLVAPVVFLPAAIILLDLAVFLPHSNKGIQLRTRNFFGTLAVRERNPESQLACHFVLQHGAIAHGAQFTHESRRREPITYFSRTSGIGIVIDHYRTHRPAGDMRLGVVGLGVGTLAAYADRGDDITFFEINPAVIDIAESDRWFTYLRDARQRSARCNINLGDGRLTLRHALDAGRPQRFDLLALDAFSGDSVPVHLLTREAFEVYMAHRAGDTSAIAVNISNRYVNLEPVLRGVAQHFDLEWLRIHNRADRANRIYSADWIILTHNKSLIESLTPLASAAQAEPPILWTDAHSNLFDTLK